MPEPVNIVVDEKRGKLKSRTETSSKTVEHNYQEPPAARIRTTGFMVLKVPPLGLKQRASQCNFR
ncbi:hypothetical protein E2C01_058110 [Portunus trituberculatus]|uniref:Uncharacterized protein n=1 Tax=Portunus trituberculatus TaxID=210409 RepID=A0A5B7GUQ6_PORTR|nr:hypothetical protein [Portunus trituberculatus]